MKTVSIQKNGEPLLSVWNANRYFLRLRGLLGRTLEGTGGLLLTPCNGIHTFGMRYEIDAVYLDKAGIVLRIDEALPRGRAWSVQRGAYRVLELAGRHAERYGIHVGDKLEVLS